MLWCKFCTNEGRYACFGGALACGLCAMLRYPGQNVLIANVPALAAHLEAERGNLAMTEAGAREHLAAYFKDHFLP